MKWIVRDGRLSRKWAYQWESEILIPAMTSMKHNQSDSDDPPQKDYKIDVAVAMNKTNKKIPKKKSLRKENQRVNYESQKLQHCHIAVVTGGTSGCRRILDPVALRFVVRVGRRCARRDAARWFESVSTWPPFPKADYAVLGGAASYDSLLEVLLDTRRRSVRIADRLHPPPMDNKEEEKKTTQRKLNLKNKRK